MSWLNVSDKDDCLIGSLFSHPSVLATSAREHCCELRPETGLKHLIGRGGVGGTSSNRRLSGHTDDSMNCVKEEEELGAEQDDLLYPAHVISPLEHVMVSREEESAEDMRYRALVLSPGSYVDVLTDETGVEGNVVGEGVMGKVCVEEGVVGEGGVGVEEGVTSLEFICSVCTVGYKTHDEAMICFYCHNVKEEQQQDLDYS